ncbi:chemotaxis protein CheX [Desulfogranum japonicum]|uniref:chemotaxis protein CheX n=1 Tax=Desulfogranum japonicum TaxID=231447 RepID=UPI00041294D6|nr:chemotaxis protein CheX [Desulfogranum japonicum]
MQTDASCNEHVLQENCTQYLIAATQDVFASMIFMDIEPGEPLTGSDIRFQTSLSSMIGLAGDLRGLVAVHCTREAALGITSSMLGMDVEELDDDVKDAIGEIANMVAGGMKVSLADHNVKIDLAIPSTAVGKSIRVSSLSKGNRVLVPFTTSAGTFGVELQYIFA